VRIQVTDVGFTLRANPGRFDVVLLDTDNGPAAFTAAANARLYDNPGVAAAFAALRPSGTLAVWSVWDDRKFEQRLRFHGFLVEVARVRARLHRGGPRHTIFVADKIMAEQGGDMGDKGGKKDKEKNKQQQLTKHKQEEQKKQDKARPKTP